MANILKKKREEHVKQGEEVLQHYLNLNITQYKENLFAYIQNPSESCFCSKNIWQSIQMIQFSKNFYSWHLKNQRSFITQLMIKTLKQYEYKQYSAITRMRRYFQTNFLLLESQGKVNERFKNIPQDNSQSMTDKKKKQMVMQLSFEFEMTQRSFQIIKSYFKIPKQPIAVLDQIQYIFGHNSYLVSCSYCIIILSYHMDTNPQIYNKSQINRL